MPDPLSAEFPDLGLLNRVHVVLSLRTDSESEARALAPMVRARLEAEWADRLGEPPDRRVARVLSLSRELGHDYRPAQQLAEAPLPELVARVGALPAQAEPSAPTTQALLGGLPPERIPVSRLFRTYEEIVQVEIRAKTAEQYRVWKSARERAVTNFMAAVGDLAIDDITHDHARLWRSWHTDRVLAGKIKAESANKDFSNFAAMLNRVLEEKRLPNSRPMAGLRVKGTKMTIYDTRPPIPEELIRGLILDEARMAGLNAEARELEDRIAENVTEILETA